MTNAFPSTAAESVHDRIDRLERFFTKVERQCVSVDRRLRIIEAEPPGGEIRPSLRDYAVLDERISRIEQVLGIAHNRKSD